MKRERIAWFVQAVLLIIVVPGVPIVSLQPEPRRTLGDIVLGFLGRSLWPLASSLPGTE